MLFGHDTMSRLPDPLLIGDWLADPRDDSLTRGSERVKVEPRTMRLLMRLALTPGVVVSQEELLESVWTGVVVSPASVYQSMSQLRKVLGDTDDPPRYIETVARKGYRLIATVGSDRTTRLWDARTGLELRNLTPPAYHVAFSPDGKRLAGAVRGGIQLWDSGSGRPVGGPGRRGHGALRGDPAEGHPARPPGRAGHAGRVRRPPVPVLHAVLDRGDADGHPRLRAHRQDRL